MIYYRQVLQEIQNTQIHQAYLLFGEEQLLADDIIKRLKKAYLGEPEAELNLFTRYATENGVDEIISLSTGMGLFSQKKLLILREADAVKSKDLERLAKVLSRQLSDICIVMQTSNSSLFQTPLKKIEDMVKTVNLLPLRENELIEFVITEFAKYKKQISGEAVDLLIFMVGHQLSDLMVQIQHVASFFVQEDKIDVAQIEQVVSVYATQDVYEYCRLIGFEEFDKASRVLLNLVQSAVSPHFLISQLLRHFSLLWRIQGFVRSGKTRNDELARELKTYYKYVEEYKKQMKFWKFSKIQNVLRALAEADRELKNNNLDDQIILDMLHYKILNS